MGIQIYDQISILINCSKDKLHCTVSLGLGLKEVQIAQNITKVSMNACLCNGHPNLLSSFNSKKLVKSETPSCGFVRGCLKGAENSNEHRESWCALLSTKCIDKSKSTSMNPIKSENSRARSMKIAGHVEKVRVHACLSNGHPNL